MELRNALDGADELVVLYVMASRQVNAKTLRFLDEAGLRERVRFLVDPESRAIEKLGLLLEDPEDIERGVAHPTTYLLDREGRILLRDARRDYHIWFAPQVILDALE